MNTFDVTLKTKNGTYEIKNNELYLDGKTGHYIINAKDANTLIEMTYEAVTNFKITQNNFEVAMKEVSYLMDTKDFLLNLKRRNCHTTIHNFMQTNHLFFRNIIAQVQEEKLSIPEQLVFNTIINGYIEHTIETYEIIYKNTKEEALAIKKDWLQFPYKNYVKNDKDILALIKEQFSIIESSHNLFEQFQKEHGNDLINWTSQKVSRRVSDYPTKSYVWGLIEEYQKELTKKGVKSNIKAKKQKVSVDNAKTDDDYVRCFKSGPVDGTWEAFQNISFKRKLQVIQEDTKVVKEKISNSWTKFVEIFEKELVPSKECVDAALNLVKRIDQSNSYYKKSYTWNFFNKNIEHISYTKFLEFKPFENKIEGEITEATFDKLITKFPKDKQLSYSSEISKQFITRMSNAEKTTVLNTYKEDKITLANDLLSEVFASLPSETLRKFVLKNPNNTSDLFILLKDNETFKSDVLTNTTMLADILDNWYGESDQKEYKKFFKGLDKKERFNAILKAYANQRSYSYCSNSDTLHIVSKEEMKELFLLEIVKESYELTSDIIEKYSDKIPERKKLIDAALNLDKPLYLDIDDTVLTCLDLSLRIKLLPHNIQFNDNQTNGYYRDSYPEYVKLTRTYKFLKGIPRNTLEKYDYFEGYTMYVADRMTKEELLEQAEQNRNFVRAHIEILPKTFLNKIKEDKAYIKSLIGDCRNHTNRRFLDVFKEATQFSNSLDFILGLAA